MIPIKQFKEEEPLYALIVEFNRLYKIYPKTITTFSYYDLWEKSGKEKFDIMNWRDFQSDMRVKRWYETELDMALDTRIHKLMQEAGSNNSTATQQTLASLLRHKEDSDMSADEGKIFVYTHWPLTNVEKHLPNVKISEAIPKEISSAITLFERDPK